MQLGVDLGGTKISVCLLDDKGQICFYKQSPTPVGDYEGTIKQIVSLIVQAQAHYGRQCTIGIGTPGSVSPTTGAMRNCNSTCLNGRYLQADLQRVLGQAVTMANDANCFALSEAIDGAAREYNCVLGVIVGTGVGSGIVVNRHLLKGANAIAGEWGHNVFSPTADNQESRKCYCGKFDCVETWLSGPGLQRSYANVSGQAVVNVEKIVELAQNEDDVASEVLHQYGLDLARALAMVVNVLDPDVIVLGGGVGQIPGLCESVTKAMATEVFSDCCETPVVLPKYGADSGVRGAARLNH